MTRRKVIVSPVPNVNAALAVPVTVVRQGWTPIGEGCYVRTMLAGAE